MSPTVRMLIGCVLPFLFIFLLPVVGISGGVTLLIVIVAFFAVDIWITRGHGDRARA